MRRIVDAVGRFYWGAGLCDDVPALAWTLVCTLVPLALGLGALATLVFDAHAVKEFAEKAADVFPKDVKNEIVQLVVVTRRRGPILIGLALAAMIWTSSGAIGVIERCLARLLDRERGGAVKRKLRHIALAVGLVALISLTVLVITETTQLRDKVGLGGGGAGAWVGFPLVGAIDVTICAALYRLTPRGGISWRAAFAGGLPAGIVLLLTPTAARFYVESVASGTAVAVFLILIGVLVTCYLAAIALIVGTGFAARVSLGHELPSAQTGTHTVSSPSAF